MVSEFLKLQWCGPYRFCGNRDESVFLVSVGERRGIYLWAIPFENQYLTYYVGETGRSFAYRSIEHAKCYLEGFYRVYDPEKFAKGEKVLIWGGMWKPNRKDLKIMYEFLEKYPKLSHQIYEFLEQFKIFLAPTNVKQRTRQRIESAIASKLLGQPGVVGKFQDADIKYLPRRAREQPIYLKMSFPETILGLNDELVV